MTEEEFDKEVKESKMACEEFMGIVFDEILKLLMNDILFPTIEGVVKDIVEKVELRSSMSEEEFIGILE